MMFWLLEMIEARSLSSSEISIDICDGCLSFNQEMSSVGLRLLGIFLILLVALVQFLNHALVRQVRLK